MKTVLLSHQREEQLYKKDCKVFFLIIYFRNLIIKCLKQQNNNTFHFRLQDHQFSIQVIPILLKKLRIAKLEQQYKISQSNNHELKNNVPTIMIDINQFEERDQSNQNKYSFQFYKPSKTSKPFWIIVKSLPLQRYPLKQGDIFRIGQINFRIKQIVDKASQIKQINKQISQAQYKVYDCKGDICKGINQDTDGFKCRICMQEGQLQNPLINLCDCTGSAKYTHFKCIKVWFTNKLISKKLSMVVEVTWDTSECQICKAKLPISINLDNEDYILVNFPKLKKPYLVLHPIDKNPQKAKIYYFVSFLKKNRLIIGRQNDTDLQLLNDATISRHHCFIQYIQGNNNKNDKFYLSDNASKFGTMVLLNTQTPIIVDSLFHGVEFQVGFDIIKIYYKTLQLLKPSSKQIDINCGSNTKLQLFEDQRKQTEKLEGSKTKMMRME